MVAADDAKIGIDRVETLAALGYDYVELPIAQMMSLDDQAFERLAVRVEKSGIKCEAANNFFSAAQRITGSQPICQKDMEAYIKKALSRAFRLGVKSIVFGSSGAKNVPENFDHSKAWAQIVQLLRVVDDLIGCEDIHIAIEPLNSAESNIVKLTSEGLALAKDVARPSIRLLVDFYHFSMENENLAVIGEAAGYLQHMHIANPAGRVWPKSSDAANYGAFFQSLKTAGYNGRISVEAYSDNFEDDAREALRTLRSAVESAWQR